MLFKSIASFSALLLAFAKPSTSEYTTTITHTNYITPDCFKAGVDKILTANPDNLATGIPIVFVYGDEADTEENPHTVVTSSEFQYTVSTYSTAVETLTQCSNKICSTSVKNSIVPYIYTTKTQLTYTTTEAAEKITSLSQSIETGLNTKSSTTKDKSIIYEYETDTEISIAKATITKKAKTTTKTIFKATTVPSTIFKPSTSVETITSTMQDPLITKPVVSKSLTKAIETSKFTDGITITSPKSNVNKQTNNTSHAVTSGSLVSSTSLNGHSSGIIGSTNTTYVHPLSNILSNTTSTIDLRISRSGYVSLTSKLPGAAVHYNISSAAESALSEGSTKSTPISSFKSTSASLSASISSASSSASSSSDLSSSVISSLSSSTSSLSVSSSFTYSTSSSYSSEVSQTSTSSAKVSSVENYSGDLFKVISTDEPPSIFPRQELPLSIPDFVDNNDVPFETNKFYANLFLGDQTGMIWSYPYSLFWKKQDYYGFGIQHTNTSDRVYGSQDTNNQGTASYYYNPTDNAEIILSSTSFSQVNNYMCVSKMTSMSVLVTLSATSEDKTNYIDLPIVQGMGFVTAVYNGNLVPELNTLIGFSGLIQESSAALPSNILKYRAILFNGMEWLIYITLPDSANNFELTADDSFHIKGSEAIDGLIIQLAVAPTDSAVDGYYDEAAGLYVTKAEVQGSVSNGISAEYKFVYTTDGSSSSSKPIIFALSHHVESSTSVTLGSLTGIKLASTTKGDMYGFLTNELVMSETLETSIQFLPWVQGTSKDLSYSADQLKLLAEVANEELSVDIDSTVASMDSNYFSGKVIDKYSYILLVVSEIIQDKEVANSTLTELKKAFEPFLNNQQYYPFMYDTKFGGLTSTASQNGDSGADFGAAYYNDHHFHYGYFVHAAAIVGHIDKNLGGTWAEDNKDWVNTLIRDVANPSEDDSYFPVSRMFDWFAGHSWASGLFAGGDGRNEESSSEDYNFAYGMKLWGKVISDNSMESRGDLMLAIMSRAMNKYFYYKSDNTVEPSQILPNKVSGILFDNKIAYTTYFGTPDEHPEYVHGIHMLPITPASSLIRIPSYVQEEWNDQISTFIGNVNSGWTGILRLNEALYDAPSSYEFFSSDDWSSTYLDNGQSRTWSLAFSGGISNAT